MKYEIEKWTAKKLYMIRDTIQFPEYQREPRVWTEKMMESLIDSIVLGIPIPPLFVIQLENGSYDCVDGQQRIRSVWYFFDGELKYDDKTVEEISEGMRSKIEKYVFIIIRLEEAKDKDLRELFIRLQLGAHLNAGEKLNAATGDMKDFVFQLAKTHPFFKNISIPTRRFAREQVLAQICLNSFSLSIRKRYQSARWERLLEFFVQFDKLDRYKTELNIVKNTLDLLDESFGHKAKELTNRALILSAYLFVENMVRLGRTKESRRFVEFYLKFIEVMKAQARKGLDYDRKYRTVVYFYSNVTQAAFEPYSIERRQGILQEFFEYYEKTGKIKHD